MLNFESLQKRKTLLFALVLPRVTDEEYARLDATLRVAYQEYTMSVNSNLPESAFLEMMDAVVEYIETRTREILKRTLYFAYRQDGEFFQIHIGEPPVEGLNITPSFYRTQ